MPGIHLLGCASERKPGPASDPLVSTSGVAKYFKECISSQCKHPIQKCLAQTSPLDSPHGRERCLLGHQDIHGSKQNVRVPDRSVRRRQLFNCSNRFTATLLKSDTPPTSCWTWLVLNIAKVFCCQALLIILHLLHACNLHVVREKTSTSSEKHRSSHRLMSSLRQKIYNTSTNQFNKIDITQAWACSRVKPTRSITWGAPLYLFMMRDHCQGFSS